jgi:type IV pilus assembly protein PilM
MPAPFGLDIGSSTIKAVQLAGSAKKPRVGGFSLGVNPLGNIETENQQELLTLATAVKKVVVDAGIRQRRVIAALPESKVFTRVVSLPQLSEVELSSAIKWEAEQYVPVPLSEVQLDWQILSTPSQSGKLKMEIFLVAAPKALINKLISILQLSGLEPRALETEIVGIARALVRNEKLPPTVVVHLGASTTDLCIVERGKLVFTQSVPTGGNALTRALAQDLSLEPQQAEQYKRAYGLDETQLQGKVKAALEPVFVSILEHIRKALRFYASGSTKESLRRMWVSGGGAYLPGLTGYLAKQLGVEVVLADPFADLGLEKSMVARLKGANALFSCAVGLAMRGL